MKLVFKEPATEQGIGKELYFFIGHAEEIKTNSLTDPSMIAKEVMGLNNEEVEKFIESIAYGSLILAISDSSSPTTKRYIYTDYQKFEAI